jgi:hypothetical protein
VIIAGLYNEVTLECLFPRDTPYDLPLVFQDRSFRGVEGPGVDFCQCFGDTVAAGGAGGDWQPEYFAPVPTVNGKIAPTVGRCKMQTVLKSPGFMVLALEYDQLPTFVCLQSQIASLRHGGGGRPG